MDTAITYEQLYSNMVKKFTIEKDKKDYKLGDYMLMKARAKKSESAVSNLPAVSFRQTITTSLVSLASFVNDKLTIKEAPIRDRTIRKFPFRTSLSALCSAVLVCALVVSCALFGIKGSTGSGDTVESQYSETQEEQNDTAYDSILSDTEE